MPATGLFALANLAFCLLACGANVVQLARHRRRLGLALGWLRESNAAAPDDDPDSRSMNNIVVLRPAPGNRAAETRRLAA